MHTLAEIAAGGIMKWTLNIMREIYLCFFRLAKFNDQPSLQSTRPSKKFHLKACIHVILDCL